MLRQAQYTGVEARSQVWPRTGVEARSPSTCPLLSAHTPTPIRTCFSKLNLLARPLGYGHAPIRTCSPGTYGDAPIHTCTGVSP